MYTMLTWLPAALSGAALIGTYNLLLEGSGKEIGSDPIAKATYIMAIMVVAGILGLLIIFGLKSKYAKSTSKVMTMAKKAPWKVLAPGFICVCYMLANILALSEGGGIVMAVINLNIFVTLIGGAMLYGDKINIKIILSLIAAMGLVTYASYESSLLKK